MKSTTLGQQLAQRAVGIRPTTLPAASAGLRCHPASRFVRFATADVDAAPAAVDADTTVSAAAADVSAAGETAKSETPSSTPSSSGRSASTVMRIGRETDSAKAATYLCIKLQEAAAGEAVRLCATAQMPSLIALKIIAKAQERLAESGSSNAITFQVQRAKAARLDESRLTVFDFFVTKVPADRLNGKLPSDRFPMTIKEDLEYGRVAAHAARQAKAQQLQQQQANVPVAVFKFDGPTRFFGEKVKVLLNGLSQARRELTADGMDLTFRVERSLYTVERKTATQEQQQEQDAVAAAEATDSAAAAQPDSSSSSSSSAEEASSTVTRQRFNISAFVCEPRTPPGRRAAAAARGRDSRGDSSRGSGSPRASRPGYVEVPAEEWAQLKEQLEVVPHLTEQLQIMTRQHEQLLSLLAAQGAAPTADGQQQQQ